MIFYLTKEGITMRKQVSKNDFEEIVGAMNKTAIYDAFVYAGISNKKDITQEEYETALAKKKKMVRSDIKHQRNINKAVTKIDWTINDN